jgi:hypothetical protein
VWVAWEAKWPRLLPLPLLSSWCKVEMVPLGTCNGSGMVTQRWCGGWLHRWWSIGVTNMCVNGGDDVDGGDVQAVERGW